MITKRFGTKHEVAPSEPTPHIVVLKRRGESLPYGHVGPMDRERADRVAASWRRAELIVTVVPIGVNLTVEEQESP